MWLSNAFAKIIKDDVVLFITNICIPVYHSISPAAYSNKLSIFLMNFKFSSIEVAPYTMHPIKVPW
jgi:hypothetical protein